MNGNLNIFVFNRGGKKRLYLVTPSYCFRALGLRFLLTSKRKTAHLQYTTNWGKLGLNANIYLKFNNKIRSTVNFLMSHPLPVP